MRGKTTERFAIGQKEVITGFLWFPRTLPTSFDARTKQTLWLERASIMYRWCSGLVDGWVEMYWLDPESNYGKE